MGKRHNSSAQSDEDMAKRRTTSTKTRAKHAGRNAKVNASIKSLYDDVVNEPVPDKMLNSIPQDKTPKG